MEECRAQYDNDTPPNEGPSETSTSQPRDPTWPDGSRGLLDILLVVIFSIICYLMDITVSSDNKVNVCQLEPEPQNQCQNLKTL